MAISHARKHIAPRPAASIFDSWIAVATPENEWSQALLSPNITWDTWCSDVESCFVKAGVLETKRPERKLGAACWRTSSAPIH